MSYCRKGKDSDVYVVLTEDGQGSSVWECLGCPLAPEEDVGLGAPLLGTTRMHSRMGMIAHLGEHLAAGHRVPGKAVVRLVKEYANRRVRE